MMYHESALVNDHATIMDSTTTTTTLPYEDNLHVLALGKHSNGKLANVLKR